MKIVKILVYVLIGIIALFFIVGFFLPSQLRFSETIEINAPKELAFEYVSNFNLFNTFSPWYGIDPNTKYDFEGEELGVGAIMKWASNDPDVGKGTMKVIEYNPPKYTRTELVFEGMGKSYADYTITEKDNGSIGVMWAFDTDFGMNIFSRYFAFIIEPAIRADYQKGLAKLKDVLENSPLTKYEIVVEEVSSIKALALRGATTTNSAEISASYAASFAKLNEFMGKNKIQPMGAPMAMAHEWDEEKSIHTYSVAMPVEGQKVKPNEDVELIDTYSGYAIKVIHIGPYDKIKTAHLAADEYARTYRQTIIGAPWEIYVNDPANTSDDELMTYVFYPVK